MPKSSSSTSSGPGSLSESSASSTSSQSSEGFSSTSSSSSQSSMSSQTGPDLSSSSSSLSFSSSSSSSSSEFGETGRTPDCDCNCPEEGDDFLPPAACDDDSYSENPVRWENGETRLQFNDVTSQGAGFRWGHSRGFNLKFAGSSSDPNGSYWFNRDSPILTKPSGSKAQITLGPNSGLFFRKDAGTGGTYSPKYGANDQLFINGAGNHILLMPNGRVYEFYPPDSGSSTAPAGALKSIITPGYAQGTYTYSGGKLTKYEQVSLIGESDKNVMDYAYFGGGDPNEGRLSSVTLKRVVGANTTNVQRVTYTYYGTGSSFGNLGDLQTATTEIWDTASSSWVDSRVWYHRYYTTTGSGAYQHGIKYVVNPENYTRISGDPLTASDSTLEPYSSHYFEYDSEGRVTKEVVDGVVSPSSNQRSTTFVYTPAPGEPAGYNQYAMKTVATYADSSKRTVYTNELGQTLLIDLENAAGTEHFVEHKVYDADARLLEHRTPAAVASYMVSGNTISVTLNASGFIRKFSYWQSSDNDPDKAPGYLKTRSVKDGSSGSEAVLDLFKYQGLEFFGFTDIHGNPVTKTIYAVKSHTVYRTASSSGSDPITTSYQYDVFLASSRPVFLRTTSLPNTGSQNGTNNAQTRELRTIDGLTIWFRDERNRLTYFEYDFLKGVPTRRVQDVNPSTITPPTIIYDSSVDPAISNPLHLETNYSYDNLTRQTEMLGPSHLNKGNTIRTAEWSFYKDSDRETWSTRGYVQSGTPYSPSPKDTVSVTKRDRVNRTIESIVAKRNTSASGPLTSAEDYSTSTDWVRRTQSIYDDRGDMTEERVYTNIATPTYSATKYAFDSRDRRTRVETPLGTITRTVFDIRGLATAIWVGTDDTGFTPSNPTGSGSNNLLQTSGMVYDANRNLTQQTGYMGASGSNRVTTFGYDFRNRQTSINAPEGQRAVRTFDNLDRVTKIERQDSNNGNKLMGQSESVFDDRNRVYQEKVYAVDITQTTPTPGTALTSERWHDAAGFVLQDKPAGAVSWTKTVYDGIGRVKLRYFGYGTGDADDVATDIIVEQAENVYSAGYNLDYTVMKRRRDTAPTSGTGSAGPLVNMTTNPSARVTYVAQYEDEIARPAISADYGTNNDASFTYVSDPASLPSEVLQTKTEYNDRGEAYRRINPMGRANQATFDDAGRVTQRVANQGSSPSQTVQYQFNAGHILTKLIAVNADTGDQETTYTYGVTTTGGSEIHSNELLWKVRFPATTEDVVHKYNRQGQVIERVDENGTEHDYVFDDLGRIEADKVTTVGSEIDNAVLRIETDYEIRGMVRKVTSYNAANGGSIVNQVEHVYNSFAQIKESRQSHSGAVGGGTLKVGYAYADGTSNTIRRTSCTYPNGRQIDYNFAATGSIDDSLSRVKSIREGANVRAIYNYLGTNFVTTTQRPESSLRSELRGGSGYAGLDRFDRVVDLIWFDYSTGTPGTVVDRIKHGYDKNSNRLWRENVKARDASAEFDWLYAYDGLDRLTDADMGTLNTGHTALTSTVFAQEWGLDATGNWKTFKEGDGSIWDLEQGRTSNGVNEITDITNTVGSAWAEPAYDDVGNMTSIPKPADIANAFTATYDAWNRLVKLEDGSDIVAEYEYDGLNRRTIEKTNYTGSTPGTVRHFYYSEQWQVLEERVDGRTNPVERQFLWGLQYIDDLIFRDRDTGDDGTLDERLYAIRDPNWNVTALWGKNSGGTAWEIKERFEYSPYGASGVFDASFSPTSDAFDWETKYAGYRCDTESGLYQVRFRYYNPTLGVWVTRDSIGYLGGDLNLYRYAHSSPTVFADSSGLLVVDPVTTFAITFGVSQATAAGVGAAGAAVAAPVIVVGVAAVALVGVGVGVYVWWNWNDEPEPKPFEPHRGPYERSDARSCIRGPSTRTKPIELPPPWVREIDTEPVSSPKPPPIVGDLSPEEKKKLADWLEDYCRERKEEESPRSKKDRKIKCRCTIRYIPDRERHRLNCPDRVLGEGRDMHECQNNAKMTAPQACRKFYGHCGPIP